MNKKEFQIGIEIKTRAGAILKPKEINFWGSTTTQKPAHLTNMTPQTPFKYYTDAILGLCYHKMNDFKFLPPEEKRFAAEAYRSLDTYTELFNKSAPRIRSLRKNSKTPQPISFELFEKQMTEVWQKTFTDKTVQLSYLTEALQVMADFEQTMQDPFLYQFNLELSEAFTEKLICFYSFLFHLRALVAVDHNAHTEDLSFESIKCDSISDYLPKSDYTVNDALLYFQFKKLSLPFVGHKDKDTRIEKLFVEPMIKHFNQLNHNACCLIEQLPKSFLSSLSVNELEEALHHVQMDWLLGSESGLLFKIREELFGLTEGYEKIFWPEFEGAAPKKSLSLNLFFKLNEKDLATESVAA